MSRLRLLVHQTRLEQRSFWRNPQTAFFTFAMPLALVLLFGFTQRHAHLPGRSVAATTVLVPGFLAFGLMICAYGYLAATLATLRSEGVLKRLRATPLPASVYLEAQVANALVIAALLTISAVGLGALVFGVSPREDHLPQFLLALVVGVASFAALGLATTAAIRSPEAAMPVTNGLLVPLAIASGSFDYQSNMPGWIEKVTSALPVKAFNDALRAGYDPHNANLLANILVLTTWLMIGGVLARRFFRWEP